MKGNLDQIEIALEQLEWAIHLFLEHKSYVCAITLSGAAEELLGKLLGQNNSLHLLKESLHNKLGFPIDEIGKYANATKNNLKHGWKDEEIEEDIEGYAISMIARALANATSLGFPISQQGQEFLRWTANNRADCCPTELKNLLYNTEQPPKN